MMKAEKPADLTNSKVSTELNEREEYPICIVFCPLSPFIIKKKSEKTFFCSLKTKFLINE